MRRPTTPLTLAAMLAASLAIPAAAGNSDQKLVIHDNILSPDDTMGEFTASGNAANKKKGVICKSGMSLSDVGTRTFDPNGSGSFFIITIERDFTCDGGSGTFRIFYDVEVDKTTFLPTWDWNVVSGTGDHVALSGSSTGEGHRKDDHPTYTGTELSEGMVSA